MSKQGALAAGSYFLIAWILTCALLPMPLTTFNWGLYFGTAGVSHVSYIVTRTDNQFLTIPIIVFVALDFPRRLNHVYQPWLIGATWIFADILVIEMHLCHFFGADNSCGTRNFLNLFAFAYGQPVLAVFALKQGRVYAVMGAVQWLALLGGLLMTEDSYPPLFNRNIVMCEFLPLDQVYLD